MAKKAANKQENVSTGLMVMPTTVEQANLILQNAPKTKADVPMQIAALNILRGSLVSEEEKAISTDIVWEDTGENIKEITKVGTLNRMLSGFRLANKLYNEERTSIQLDGRLADMTISEKTFAEWEPILKKRIHELVNAKQLAGIDATIEKMSKYISEDEKLQRDLADAAKTASALIS